MSYRERKTKNKNEKECIDTENTLVIARGRGGSAGWGGVRETDEGGEKVQTSSYKISKFWGCSVQPGDYT